MAPGGTAQALVAGVLRAAKRLEKVLFLGVNAVLCHQAPRASDTRPCAIPGPAAVTGEVVKRLSVDPNNDGQEWHESRAKAPLVLLHPVNRLREYGADIHRLLNKRKVLREVREYVWWAGLSLGHHSLGRDCSRCRVAASSRITASCVRWAATSARRAACSDFASAISLRVLKVEQPASARRRRTVNGLTAPSST